MAVKETVVLSVETDSSKAEGSVKSLKAQLREAQAEVALMADKFGETSTQAVEAAKKAAQLKDRIGDAKALTDAFNPDKKFQAFSSALQGVAGGFAALQGAQALFGSQSKELEETLVKVQGAMALSQGLSAITESADAFKNLKAVAVNTFQAIKGAIGATGIGLLLVALGAIYTYWDDIKEAVSGVSAEQKKLLETQKKSAETAQKSLDSISKQENVLRLQGKSEREILQLKIAGTKQVISSLQAQLLAQESIKDTQIETAARNQKILKGILDFLMIPLKSLLDTVDWIGKKFGKDFDLTKKLSSMVFDPKEVKENADKSIEETKTKLKDLENQQAGFQLEIKKIDDDASKKRKETQDKNAEELREANKKANEDILKLQQENTLARIADDRKRAEAKLEMDLESAKKEVESSKASAELKAKQIQALEEKYMLDLRAMQEKNRIEDEKKAKENLDKQLKAESETFKIVNDARINQIKDENIKRQEIEAQRYQTDIDNLYTQLNNKEITEADFNARREAARLTHETNLTAIEKQNKEERVKIAEAEYNAKIGIWNLMGDAMGALSDAIGKTTAVGKSMALAELAINTGVALSGIVRQASKNPMNLSPFQLAADIAIRTAAVINNIKKAKELLNSAKVGGGGGGGGSMPGVGGTAPIAPQMSQTALNQQMINQVGNASTRAFVLETDVSGNQERIRRLNRAARIN